MRTPILFDHGTEREPKTRWRTTAVAPVQNTLEAYNGETLGSLALRAYGANTENNRDKLRRANATLEGNINVPR